jgi:hypothetical protein
MSGRRLIELSLARRPATGVPSASYSMPPRLR